MSLSRSARHIAGALSLLALLAACGDDAAAPAPERYILALSGTNERPNPVASSASASALITVLGRDSVEFLIYVAGADSITASHIHAGDANSAGPIMVFTFGGPVTGRVDGIWRHGFITRDGTFSGVFSFDSLMTRMRAGTAYLNIHTRRYGAGELRGQIVR